MLRRVMEWLWEHGVKGVHLGPVEFQITKVQRHERDGECPCCARAAEAAGKALEYRHLLAETYALLMHPPQRRVREVENEHRDRILRALGGRMPGPPS
jgi:hypothetical protein